MTRTEKHVRPGRARVADPASVLLDGHGRPVRTLRLSVTDRCNHRCLYCMPEHGIRLLPRDSVMRIEEMVTITEALAGAGIRRVRITGGEPLVREALTDLIARISALPGLDSLAITTNGSLLESQAASLMAAGAQRLNVSLDTLTPDRFRTIARRPTLSAVLRGLDAAHRSGFRNIHINTVAVNGFNDDELMDICRFAWEIEAIPRFIELMPTGHTGYFSPEKVLPAQAVVQRLETQAGCRAEGTTERPGYGPARYYRLGGLGLFGVIPSVTGHICPTCDRIRLRATGELQTCLVRPAGPNLRDILRTSGDKAMLEAVRRALRDKADRPEELTGPVSAMSSVGG